MFYTYKARKTLKNRMGKHIVLHFVNNIIDFKFKFCYTLIVIPHINIRKGGNKYGKRTAYCLRKS